MLDDVRRRVDDSGDKYLLSRESHVLPHLPLVLVAPVGPYDGQGGRPPREQHVDNVSEWYVVVVWRLTGTPADVHADVLRCNITGGGVERLDILGHYCAELRDREIRKPGAAQGEVRAVELQEETGLDDGVVLPLHHLCHGFQVGLSARVVSVREKVGERARGDSGHEHLFHREAGGRRLEVGDVLLDCSKILPRYRSVARRP